MDVLDKLERRFGRYAISNLMTYIVGANAVVYFASLTSPRTDLIGKLMLSPGLVLKGELWRLITFVFIPPSMSLLWALIILYFYYFIGSSLEHEWGSFRFNIYYFVGMTGTALSAFVSGQSVTAFYLNLSLFLAFAYIFPNYQILLFFIVPVKVKYLAWLDAAFLGSALLTGSLSVKLSVTAALMNFLLFFGKDIMTTLKLRGGSYARRRKFRDTTPRQETFHRCTVCGITEKDDAAMDFRYCSKCEGRHEYCAKHLLNHEHVRKDAGDIQ
jgi:hypothetical protein